MCPYDESSCHQSDAVPIFLLGLRESVQVAFSIRKAASKMVKKIFSRKRGKSSRRREKGEEGKD